MTKAEGKKGQTTLFTFTVTLSAAYDQPVTMSFRTANGTAKTSDSDYVAKTGTLTFAPGETTKTITIEVKGDSKREANEYVLPGPVRQQQQLAVHQESRHRHDPERRLMEKKEVSLPVLNAPPMNLEAILLCPSRRRRPCVGHIDSGHFDSVNGRPQHGHCPSCPLISE